MAERKCPEKCRHAHYHYCPTSGTHCDVHCDCPCEMCEDERRSRARMKRRDKRGKKSD